MSYDWVDRVFVGVMIVLTLAVLGLIGWLIWDEVRPRLTEGEVIEKRYERESFGMIMMPISTGKSTILVPFYFHDGEDWKLKLRQGEKTDWVYVDQATFDKAREGAFYGGEGAASEDPTYTKEERS
jgi:hypothetical protein